MFKYSRTLRMISTSNYHFRRSHLYHLVTKDEVECEFRTRFLSEIMTHSPYESSLLTNLEDNNNGNDNESKIQLTAMDEWDIFKDEYIKQNQQFIDIIETNINSIKDYHIRDGGDHESKTNNDTNTTDNINTESIKEVIQNLENKLEEYKQFNTNSLENATQTLMDRDISTLNDDGQRTKILPMDSDYTIESKLQEISDRQIKHQKELHSHVLRIILTIVITLLAILAYMNPKRNKFPE